MKKQYINSLIASFFSCSLFAGGMGTIEQTSPLVHFYGGAAGGYGNVDGAYKQDGNVAQARLDLGVRFNAYHHVNFGAEIGVQTGNTMRLNASPAIIANSGGLPIQSTLKPLLDLLGTVKGPIFTNFPLAYVLKGGIAYRQLQLEDRTSAHDYLSQVNGEFQAGLNYDITKHLAITAFYQGIYNTNNAGISLDATGDTSILHIPTQQSGFLGLEYSF